LAFNILECSENQASCSISEPKQAVMQATGIGNLPAAVGNHSLRPQAHDYAPDFHRILFAAYLRRLVQHRKLLCSAQFLDLVPGQRIIAQRIAMEGDLACALVQQFAVPHVPVDRYRHVRGRLALGCAGQGQPWAWLKDG
jgi:hypothetical protein